MQHGIKYFVVLFTEINQPIRPAELPIIGDPYTEISLDLLFPTKTATFALIGKQVQLTQPLDRDAENLSHIVFQVTSEMPSLVISNLLPIIILGHVCGEVYEQEEDHTHNCPHD